MQDSRLRKFLKSISSVEEEEGSEKKTSKEEPGSPESIVIPKFLQKFSSTYFKKATLPGGMSPSKLGEKEKSPKPAAGKKTQKIVKKHMTHHKRSSSATNLREASIALTPEKSIGSYLNNHHFLPLLNANNRITDQTNPTEQKDNNLMSVNPTNMYSHYEDEESFKKQVDNSRGKQDLDTIIQFDTEENNVMSQLNPNAPTSNQNKLRANKDYLKDIMKENKANNIKKIQGPTKSVNVNPYKSPNDQGPNHDQGLHILNSENDENEKREKKKFNKSQMEYFSMMPNIFAAKGDLKEARLRHNRFHSAINLKKNHSFSNDLLNSSLEDIAQQENTTKRGPNDSPEQNNLERSVANCLICFDKPPDAVFMECGHGGVCYECSLELWKSTEECYLCRMKIKQVLQIDPKNKNGNYIKVVSATHMVKEGKVKKN